VLIYFLTVASAAVHKMTPKFDKFNIGKSVPMVSRQTLVGTDLKMNWVWQIL